MADVERDNDDDDDDNDNNTTNNNTFIIYSVFQGTQGHYRLKSRIIKTTH